VHDVKAFAHYGSTELTMTPTFCSGNKHVIGSGSEGSSSLNKLTRIFWWKKILRYAQNDKGLKATPILSQNLPNFTPYISHKNMSNNDIMKKLRVALHFTDDDIIKVLDLANFRITKTELGAIFRKEDHPNFKPCGDQILRNFLNGLIIYKRGPKEGTPDTAKS
jgi:hypothetical protein